MPKRKPEPFADRPIGVEYYHQLVHKNPALKTATKSELNALIVAAKHLDGGDYIKVVAYDRKSSRVLWTRMKIGKHLIIQTGKQHGDEVKVIIPDAR